MRASGSVAACGDALAEITQALHAATGLCRASRKPASGPDLDHLARLTEGVAAWNRWREVVPGVQPRVEAVRLSGAVLAGIDLDGADHLDTDLNDADLDDAKLNGARIVHRAAFVVA